MTLYIGIPLFIIGALLQATVFSHLRVFGGQPDLVVLVVLVWSLLDHRLEGMVWAFIGGFFLDLFSGTPLGISSLALLPIAYVVGAVEAQMFRASLLPPLLLTAAGALAFHVIYLILLRFIGGISVPLLDALWYVTLPSVAFDVILALPLLRLLTGWYDRTHPRLVKI